MSFASSLLQYALNAAKSQAQQMALAAIKSGAQQLTAAITKHAPDLAEQANAKILDGVDKAVGGVMTRTQF